MTIQWAEESGRTVSREVLELTVLPLLSLTWRRELTLEDARAAAPGPLTMYVFDQASPAEHLTWGEIAALAFRSDPQSRRYYYSVADRLTVIDLKHSDPSQVQSIYDDVSAQRYFEALRTSLPRAATASGTFEPLFLSIPFAPRSAIWMHGVDQDSEDIFVEPQSGSDDSHRIWQASDRF